MTNITHSQIDLSTGINMHVVEAGEGPAVVFCHGFPELWYSWRHQLPVVAEAGFRAIAPDLRGYGGTDAPPNAEDFTQELICADMVALLDALEIESAVFVGHDWAGPSSGTWLSIIPRVATPWPGSTRRRPPAADQSARGDEDGSGPLRLPALLPGTRASLKPSWAATCVAP